MRLQENVNKNTLQATNLATLKGYAKTTLEKSPYWPLLWALAEIADTNAGIHNAYCTVGATKEKTALVFTANENGAKGAVYAPTLDKLALEVSSLLDSV